MSASGVRLDDPGRSVLLTGNEAVARGALEAGIAYASSYPGSPSAEVLEVLAALAEERGFYAEWSVNEKVALEGAAAASLAGLRSICIMKADGLNVALDTLTALSASGTKGGLVVVVADDPGAHSSVKEEDSRYLGKVAHLVILEPADPQEARDMTVAAFGLAEQLRAPVMLRCVTRVCHASGNVVLGTLPPKPAGRPHIGCQERYITHVAYHRIQEERLAQAREIGEGWPFNAYQGPPEPEILVITAGPGYLYAREAVEVLGLEGRVGILKLGMSWPLPEKFLLRHLKSASKVLFVEEVEPFHEENVGYLVACHLEEVFPLALYGKKSGHVAGPKGPGLGEIDVDTVIRALAALAGIPYEAQPGDYGREARELVKKIPRRELGFCAGCPHRASFWALKTAIALDGREVVVLGDIGCYTLGAGRSGHYLMQTVHAMGSGVGMASGLGKLERLGFSQPVVALVGDSTFYHAAVPALINARYNQSRFLLVVLDNGTTAMTGHQPHPGSGVTALGKRVPALSMEEVAGAFGIPVTVHDPYDVKGAVEALYRLLRQDGVRVLVLRRAYALLTARQEKKPRVYVDPKRCLGDACGCHRFCSRVFGCPANTWDAALGRAKIDETVCTGCGVCATLCPQGAIVVEEVTRNGA
ncbi:thiamine pyrophosphate-dependent enzyme [Desulfovirgula thermocuniculi]|uniref:thiamine pyrophosphate-dependent enzyme n=1 Tax=Desulfovirgula thermocuniculi TaxID=348842 RepID=UPI00041D27C0|nr:thiamine pyrophosphate-dependent enzyme [Desulfovirgula thermocuniculi]